MHGTQVNSQFSLVIGCISPLPYFNRDLPCHRRRRQLEIRPNLEGRRLFPIQRTRNRLSDAKQKEEANVLSGNSEIVSFTKNLLKRSPVPSSSSVAPIQTPSEDPVVNDVLKKVRTQQCPDPSVSPTADIEESGGDRKTLLRSPF